MTKTKDMLIHFQIGKDKYEAQIIAIVDYEHDYGADIDGNRGVPMEFVEKYKILSINNLTQKKEIPHHKETVEMHKAIDEQIDLLSLGGE